MSDKTNVASHIHKNLVLVINDLKAGGAQRVLTTLANAWSGQGRQVCIITLAGSDTDFFPLEDGVRRIAIGRPRRSRTRLSGCMRSLRRIAALRRSLQQSTPAVIVSFLPVMNILTVLAAAGLGCPVVLCERNDPGRQELKWPWGLLRRRLYRRADIITANSRGVLDTLGAYVPENRLSFVPNPVTVTAVPARTGGDAAAILAVGRLVYQKAYDILLEAFARIAPAHPDWRLDIIGDGPLKNALYLQAQQLGIGARVAFHGTVADPFPYYRSAAVYVLPSRFEGMPNALLEAMACGLPAIVSSASPGPLEYVRHGQTGLVVPPEDSAALAGALQLLIGDPDLRRRLGAAAASCLTGCTLQEVLQVWEDILTRLPDIQGR